NRPTIPAADYAAAKKNAAARQAPGQPKPGAPAPQPPSGLTLVTQVASVNESQTTFGTSTPPDGDIATSAQWMIQTTNDQVVMYNWLTNAYVQKNLPTLFQTSPPSLVYDPRVIYDPYWDRFTVLAAGCNPCFAG